MRKIFIITGVLSLLILGWQLTTVIRDYYAGNDQMMTHIDQMQRLQFFSRTGIARYDDGYATTHKVGDKYTFTVYGKPYYHHVEIDNPPQTATFDVQYLPDDPNVQSIDPVKEIALYRQRLVEKQEAPAYSWVLIFLGLAGVIYSTFRIIKN